MTTHEVLVAARNLADGTGCCVTNATFQAVGELDIDAQRRAHAVLGPIIGLTEDEARELRCFWRWHDTPGRTKAEVLAAFDKAIAATAPAPSLENVTDTAPLLERVA